MKKKGYTWASILLCLACAFNAAQAQTVWRCGEGGRSYSQSPCPGGKAVEAADKRSAADAQAAQHSVKRSQDLADRMRKQRLEDEKRNLSANARAANLGPDKVAAAKPLVKPKKKPKSPRRQPQNQAAAEGDGTLRAAVARSPQKRD
jgi:Domain of unknown function (DUF4124)